jgi:membrane-associated phospholipid phosphatase
MRRAQQRFRDLELYQIVFNLGASAILLTRWKTGPWLAVNVALLAFIIFIVPRLVRARGWRGHLGDVYFLPAFMFYYLETDVLHTAIYGSFMLDGWLARADVALFGGQPSLSFQRVTPSPWIGELMSLGYLAFYPLVIIAGMSRLLRLTSGEAYERLVRSMTVMFMSCYVMFTLLPAAGPRYVFADASAAIHGFVAAPLLQAMLELGERPTGAFPSSHVAFIVVLAAWCWTFRRRAFWAVQPIAVVLSLATVYIQAHYAVDVLAGLGFGALVAAYSKRSAVSGVMRAALRAGKTPNATPTKADTPMATGAAARGNTKGKLKAPARA